MANSMSQLLDLYSQNVSQRLQKQMHDEQQALQREQMAQSAAQFAQNLEETRANRAAELWNSMKSRNLQQQQLDEAVANRIHAARAAGEYIPAPPDTGPIPLPGVFGGVGSVVKAPITPEVVDKQGNGFIITSPAYREKQKKDIELQYALKQAEIKTNILKEWGDRASKGDPVAANIVQAFGGGSQDARGDLANALGAATANKMLIERQMQRTKPGSPAYNELRQKLEDADIDIVRANTALEAHRSAVWAPNPPSQIPILNYSDNRTASSHASVINEILAPRMKNAKTAEQRTALLDEVLIPYFKKPENLKDAWMASKVRDLVVGQYNLAAPQSKKGGLIDELLGAASAAQVPNAPATVPVGPPVRR